MTSYEAISALNLAARQANVEAEAHNVASDNDMKEELIKSCVQPGVTYYFNQLATSIKEPLEAFKATITQGNLEWE